MANKGNYVKPMPIGSNVITTDDVIAAGYDFAYLKMGGMLKVQPGTVDGDLTVKGDTAYAVVPLSLTTVAANRSVVAGADTTLTLVVAGGVTPYTYRWFKAPVSELQDEYPSNGVEILVADNATANTTALTLTAVTEDDEAYYYAIVADSVGNTVVTPAAVVTVTAA